MCGGIVDKPTKRKRPSKAASKAAMDMLALPIAFQSLANLMQKNLEVMENISRTLEVVAGELRPQVVMSPIEISLPVPEKRDHDWMSVAEVALDQWLWCKSCGILCCKNADSEAYGHNEYYVMQDSGLYSPTPEPRRDEEPPCLPMLPEERHKKGSGE